MGDSTQMRTTVHEEEMTQIRHQTTEPFRPHGILQLPQAIASALASDFLSKAEIQSLGVTCRWMLVSLNQCVINHQVEIKYVINRAQRQALAATRASDSRKTTASSRLLAFWSLVASIPNLWIGRFRCIRVSVDQVSELRIVLSELGRLEDVQSVEIHLDADCMVYVQKQLKYPILLPPRIQELIIPSVDPDWFRLSDCVLPPSLTRIQYSRSSNFGKGGFRQGRSSTVTWPKESQITELLNVPPNQQFNNMPLPNGLLTLTFHSDETTATAGFTPPMKQLADRALPTSITNLEIHRWEDIHSRFRDLPFPSQLRRLVFTADISRNDFDLTQWSHLPASCRNLELRLVGPERQFAKRVNRFMGVTVVVPPFIEQLRLHREVHYPDLWSIPNLKLTNSTSLTTFLTDSLERIEWPTQSALVSVKSSKLDEAVLKANLPKSIQELDLIASTSDFYDSLSHLFTSFPALSHLRLTFTIDHDQFETREVKDILEKLKFFSGILSTGIIVEGQIKIYHWKTLKKVECYQFKDTKLIKRFLMSLLEEEYQQIDRQRFDTQPILHHGSQ